MTGTRITPAWTLNEGVLVHPVTKTSGVVLIDEVDLHLHPRWQSQVLPALRRIFPRVQLIVTTHSPLVLASAQNHQVRQLRRGRVVDEVAAVHGNDPNSVLQNVQGSDLRPPWAVEALAEISRLIDERQPDQARARLNDLMEHWGADHPSWCASRPGSPGSDGAKAPSARPPLTLPLRAPSSVRPPEEGEPDTLSFSALQAIFDRRRAANPATAPRSLFDALLDKAAARRALHKEQAGRCAFCERQVQPVASASSTQKPAAMRVAHWRPLSALPARALDWNNLFGSCHAGGAEPHRDLAQGDTDPVLPDDQAAPSPSGADYASWLKLLPDGTLEPVADAPACVTFVLLMLNLNAPNLKGVIRDPVSLRLGEPLAVSPWLLASQVVCWLIANG